MANKRKRRLTPQEIEDVRAWMNSAPQGRKPNIRQIAKRYGINQPSVVKSLGGWKGIRRGKPEPPKKSKMGNILEQGKSEKTFELEGFTTKTNIDYKDL